MNVSARLSEILSRSSTFKAGKSVVVTMPGWQYDLLIEENSVQPGESLDRRAGVGLEILKNPKIKLKPADVESVCVSDEG